MLKRIQRVLTDLYDLELPLSVDDFVCDEEAARATVGDAVERGEVLLVAEEPDGCAIGLYVHEGAVAALEDRGDAPLDGRFEAWSLATEGVSHFVYLTFRVENDEAVSQLELELQAEVDKYATGLLAGNGVGAIRERSRALRHRLFEDVDFLDGVGTEEGDRYRTAHRLAAKYALRLERHFVDTGELGALERELRRFYRLGLRQKAERIAE